MVRIFIFFIFFSIFNFSVSTAQKQEFDSIYSITIREIVYSNPKEAIENTDYLVSISTDNNLTIRALLLKAEIFRMAGLQDEAIHVLHSADSLVDSSNHKQSLLIQGLLATNYRERKSPVASQRHLEEAKKIVQHISDQNERYKLLSNIHQEISYGHTEQKEYEKAIENIHKSNEYLELIDSTEMDRKFGWALNYQILGENYFKLHNTDSSIIYLNLALKELKESLIPESSLKGFVLNGLAKNMVLKTEYDRAEEYFDLAEAIGNESENKLLLKDLYSSKTSFYKEIGDNEKYIANNERYLELIDQEEMFERKLNESLIHYLNLQSVTEEKKEPRNFLRAKYLIPGIIILSMIFFVRIKRNKTMSLGKSEETQDQKESQSDQSNREYMSEEAMKSIIEKLKEMEAEKFFLENSLSLASVAAEVGVNHRYLSHAINQKLGKDFTSYINDLRIEYIVNFLKEDPKHLHYKISYLAEISGFSSHNRFSIIFKKSKGISPSELIQQLQEEQELKDLYHE